MNKRIDINCDIGEGVANDEALMPWVSSCNIACGGHAGDEASIRTTLRLAKKYNLKIGAHPSYPDKENFGRKVLDISKEDLKESLQHQLAAFAAIVEEEQGYWHHIKPHGALYNAIAKDERLALEFLEAIAPYLSDCFLYAPFQSRIAEIAIRSGFKIKYEAFADRNYNSDLSLVSRLQHNALITLPEEVLHHLLKMVLEERVKTISGQVIPIKAGTFCIHGDTPSALKILMYLHQELPKFNIQL
ncbi:MAG: 5-oxoprolinase subunit PxpA [Bacteroidota bacterium]